MNDLPAELSPWGDPAWRDSALAWVRDRLGAAGVRPASELEPRLRPWSVTGRIRTDRGPVWFKANPPGSRFEPALMAALSRWVPGQVLTPLAIDPERGWSLLPDGGVILGTLPGLDAGLAASPVPASLDHSDLHDYQVFVTDGRYTFFDWGDASIGHPFTSLLVILRAAAARHGLAAGPAALGRLRDAYLEPWTAERPAPELRHDARLAIRLGAISRALSWQRAFPQAAPRVRQDQGRSVAYWLTRLLEPDPD